jgi:hypothetical protein
MIRLIIAGGRDYSPFPADASRLDALAATLPPITELLSGRAGCIWAPHAGEDSLGGDRGEWLYPPKFGQIGNNGESYDTLNSMWLNLLVRTELRNIRGADVFGEWWAVKRQLAVRAFPADWRGHRGRGAGPIRNRQMALYTAAAGPAGCGVAVLFPGGKGTASMADEAKRAGLVIHDWRS